MQTKIESVIVVRDESGEPQKVVIQQDRGMQHFSLNRDGLEDVVKTLNKEIVETKV
jgi:hypothetical protein